MTRYVIYCEAMGVYVGPIYGNKQLWAKLKRDNLRYAAETFASAEEATARGVTLWAADPSPPACRAVEVQADGAGYATLAACVLAGLPEVPEPVDPEQVPNVEWVRGAMVLEGGKGL